MEETGSTINELQEATALDDTMQVIVETADPKTKRTKLSTLLSWLKAKLGIGSLVTNIKANGTTVTVTKEDGSEDIFETQDNDTTYADATQDTAGLMSTKDKILLDWLKDLVITEEVDVTITNHWYVFEKTGYYLAQASLSYTSGDVYVEWVNHRGGDRYTVWLSGSVAGTYTLRLVWVKNTSEEV